MHKYSSNYIIKNKTFANMFMKYELLISLCIIIGLSIYIKYWPV